MIVYLIKKQTHISLISFIRIKYLYVSTIYLFNYFLM